MKQRGFLFLVLILLALITIPVRAQEEEEEPEEGTDIPIESDWSDLTSIYSAGDRTFTLSAGIIFPTVFRDDSGEVKHNIELGGTGSISLHFFLTSHIFVGGSLDAMFTPTISKKMFFMVPVGLTAGYQFVIGRFELPLSVMVGIAPQKYIEEGYFGLIVKPMASIFFRFNPGWSFGLNASWWWTPQWPKSRDNIYGNFLGLTLSAAYHF